MQTLYINHHKVGGSKVNLDDDFLRADQNIASLDALATSDIEAIMMPSKTKTLLPGFNNSFDLNRSQDSIIANLLDNTLPSPRKVGNNLLMPEINLMLSGRALIDHNAGNLSPWDGRIEVLTKKPQQNKSPPVKLIHSTKKQVANP